MIQALAAACVLCSIALMGFTPMLLVEDVQFSSTWLRQILPLSSAHGGPDFEMLADSTGDVVAWLHALNADHMHPQLSDMRPGHFTGGAIFYLQVPEIESIYKKALAQQAVILEKPHVNPLARFKEFTFEDPNGYRFAVHTAFASEASQSPT